jgi:predicted lactoylglutathione lyase
MPKQINMPQYINAYDMVLLLISQKEEIIAKTDAKRYKEFFQREVAELQQLRNVLLSLSYIVDYSLVRTMVQAVEAAQQDINLAGVTVRYPFRPVITCDDNFSLIDLCTYAN